jgi:hypothetical protein
MGHAAFDRNPAVPTRRAAQRTSHRGRTTTDGGRVTPFEARDSKREFFEKSPDLRGYDGAVR